MAEAALHARLKGPVSPCKLDGGHLCQKQPHARTSEHDANKEGWVHSGSGLNSRMIERTTKETPKVQRAMSEGCILVRLKVEQLAGDAAKVPDEVGGSLQQAFPVQIDAVFCFGGHG